MHDLNESTAIVTGGARGIGLSLARALAENGARVGLVDILQDVESAATDLTRHTGKESLGIQADVRDPEAIDAAFSRADRVTLTGSITPTAIRSPYSPDEAFRPWPGAISATFDTTT